MNNAKRAVWGLISVLLLWGCSAEEPIKIGFLGGLSGRVADLGIAGRNGALLAVELANAEGGVKGRPVTLVVRDDAQDPVRARTALKELLDERVMAVIGPMTSVIGMAVVPMVNEAGVVMVSPTVTTDLLQGLDDYFFRVLSSSQVYAYTSAEHQYGVLGLRRVALVIDIRNAAYSENWGRNYRREFERLGGEVITEHRFESSPDVHFHELANAILKDDPDGVQLVTNALDAALLIQQLRKLSPGGHIATSEWAATEKLVELGGRAVEGVMIAQFFDRESRLPTYLAFREVYRNRFGEEPGFGAVAAYDATRALLRALGQADREDLKARLLSVKRFEGVQGPFAFDSYGDAARPTILVRIEEGRFKVVSD